MAIYFNEATKTFYLESKDITYAMKVHHLGYLEHAYFGARIEREDVEHIIARNQRCFNNAAPNTNDYWSALNNMCLEMPVYGNGDFRECMIQIEQPNGSRLCDMKYEGYEILKEKPALCGMIAILPTFVFMKMLMQRGVEGNILTLACIGIAGIVYLVLAGREVLRIKGK